MPPPDRPKRSEGKNNAIVQYRCSGAERRGVGLSRQPAGVTTKKKKGGADFWGKSGVQEKRGSSEADARPFEGSRMTYRTEFCRKNEEGDDLDRFADLVSLVELVGLVELGGRKDG